nr:AMP-binding protein [uncultured Holophaga sp.]
MLLDRYTSGTYTSFEDFQERFRVQVPEDFNFAYDVVDILATEKPDAPALVWCDDKGNEATFTFSDLKRWSDKAANAFQAAGIRKGDPVMLILKRRYEYWFCILALHKLGAVGIPATHLLTRKDIVYRNNAASVKMILAVNEPQVVQAIAEARPDSPTLETVALVGGAEEDFLDFSAALEHAPEAFTPPAEGTVNDDTMLLYFTSGTTGYPKMVRHDFTYPLGHILTAKYWQQVQPGGLHLTVADTGWAKSAWGKLYGQWLCECAVFVYDFEKFVPRDLLQVLADHGVTSFCAPPTFYRYFIKEDLRSFDLSRLKAAAVAGEPLNPEIYHQFLEMTGLKLMEGYGQTELTLTLGTYPGLEPRPGSMGKPSPGYDIDIIDEEGRSCEVGEVGELIVRTDRRRPVGMFGGYHRDPERTASVWCDGIYHTGDTAWRDEDGYYWFVGRTDDIIKSSGYRIGPFEVESALLEHPAVLECAITGVPDEMRGAVVKATLVLARGYEPSDALKVELQEHVKSVTAPYKYPRIIEFVEVLPKTISGKIRRVEIREHDA